MQVRSKVLFVGNDINNLNNEKSWENLVAELRRRVGKDDDANDLIKQFPSMIAAFCVFMIVILKKVIIHFKNSFLLYVLP